MRKMNSPSPPTFGECDGRRCQPCRGGPGGTGRHPEAQQDAGSGVEDSRGGGCSPAVPPAGRTIYVAGAYVVENERVASLRKQLDAAQVAYSAAEAADRRAYALALVPS